MPGVGVNTQPKPQQIAKTQGMNLPAGAARSSTVAPPSGGQMRFPLDLEKQPFWISFSFYQYNMPSLTDQSVYYADQGTIRLPLPTSLRDEWNTEYSVENLSLLTGMATNAVQQGSGSTAGVTAGLALADRATGGQLSKAATSQPAQVGLQSQGATLNPFLTVMFKQPSFKHHNMQWKLTPSNEQESLQLNQIINTFRSNMLPDKNSALGGSLLTYPNIVQAAISVNDGSYFTYVFKPAVVTNFTIDFTPSGQPSFFGSSQSPAPTEALLGLQMMEIEYWLSSDFGLLGRQVSASSIAQAIQNGIAGLF